jgi:hypothetical protein
MQLGGVEVKAGLVLDIAHGDYLYGDGRILLRVATIIEVRDDWDREWVVLDGEQQRHLHGPWSYRRLQIKSEALRRSLVLSAV